MVELSGVNGAAPLSNPGFDGPVRPDSSVITNSTVEARQLVEPPVAGPTLVMENNGAQTEQPLEVEEPGEAPDGPADPEAGQPDQTPTLEPAPAESAHIDNASDHTDNDTGGRHSETVRASRKFSDSETGRVVASFTGEITLSYEQQVKNADTFVHTVALGESGQKLILTPEEIEQLAFVKIATLRDVADTIATERSVAVGRLHLKGELGKEVQRRDPTLIVRRLPDGTLDVTVVSVGKGAKVNDATGKVELPQMQSLATKKDHDVVGSINMTSLVIHPGRTGEPAKISLDTGEGDINIPTKNNDVSRRGALRKLRALMADQPQYVAEVVDLSTPTRGSARSLERRVVVRPVDKELTNDALRELIAHPETISVIDGTDFVRTPDNPHGRIEIEGVTSKEQLGDYESDKPGENKTTKVYLRSVDYRAIAGLSGTAATKLLEKYGLIDDDGKPTIEFYNSANPTDLITGENTETPNARQMRRSRILLPDGMLQALKDEAIKERRYEAVVADAKRPVEGIYTPDENPELCLLGLIPQFEYTTHRTDSEGTDIETTHKGVDAVNVVIADSKHVLAERSKVAKEASKPMTDDEARDLFANELADRIGMKQDNPDRPKLEAVVDALYPTTGGSVRKFETLDRNDFKTQDEFEAAIKEAVANIPGLSEDTRSALIEIKLEKNPDPAAMKPREGEDPNEFVERVTKEAKKLDASDAQIDMLRRVKSAEANASTLAARAAALDLKAENFEQNAASLLLEAMMSGNTNAQDLIQAIVRNYRALQEMQRQLSEADRDLKRGKTAEEHANALVAAALAGLGK